MWPNPEFPADLVTFTEEILNGKVHFLCNAERRIETQDCSKDKMHYGEKAKEDNLKLRF